MNILVTGGAGFIGSHVVDKFIELGHTVAVIDNFSTGVEANLNPDAIVYSGDLRDRERMSQVFQDFRPQVVDHHAAQIDVRKSLTDPVLDAETNVVGSIILFEMCVKFGVERVIYASTGGALYGEPLYNPVSESHPVNPLSPYGASKHAVEHYLYIYHQLFGLDYLTLRYANVYGPRQRPDGEAGVIAIFCGRLLEGKPLVVFGDGTQTRDYVFISDVVAANVLALDARIKSGTYNIGTGTAVSVNELISILQDVSGMCAQVRYAPAREGEVKHISLNFSSARRDLGWMPIVDLKQGIKITLEYIKSSYPTALQRK